MGQILAILFREKGWSGAGVGVGMLKGAGDSLTWKVYWFLGFWFIGFKVSWFQSFEDSKIHFIFSEKYWSCIQDFQNKTDAHDFLVPAFSNNVNNVNFRKFEMYKQYISRNDISWIVWSLLGSPKIKMIGLGSHGHVQNPEIIEMRSFGFPHTQIEKLEDQNGPE